MTTVETADGFLCRFHDVFPPEIADNMDKVQAGMGAVLRKLALAGGTLTAGEISKEIEISTARVAVILKNLEAGGLITRTKSEKDKRVTIVTITDTGFRLQQEHMD